MTHNPNFHLSGGGRFEESGSYARLRRVGPHVLVAGTTAVEPSGRLYAPGDTYAQSIYVFDRIARLLAEAGASLTDVVRTRAYLADISDATEYVRAHGESFRGVWPVATAVGGILTVDGMMVEVELDAIVQD